jgi:hypothetical protein
MEDRLVTRDSACARKIAGGENQVQVQPTLNRSSRPLETLHHMSDPGPIRPSAAPRSKASASVKRHAFVAEGGDSESYLLSSPSSLELHVGLIDPCSRRASTGPHCLYLSGAILERAWRDVRSTAAGVDGPEYIMASATHRMGWLWRSNRSREGRLAVTLRLDSLTAFTFLHGSQP